jgi:hypothetical protein
VGEAREKKKSGKKVGRVLLETNTNATKGHELINVVY